MRNSLPVDAVLPELREALRTSRNAVLVAEPGAGKTTRVPAALMEEPWLGGRKIVMLEPRRLAARMAARYMASSLGESAGERIGYRVRLDTKVSSRTVIEVVTEGVLTRMLQDDPSLSEVGLLIFDEFHERSLHADIGLAFSLQAQAYLREDLRILVMSATLEAEPIADLLGGAPIVRSLGRAFPVETKYATRPRSEGRRLEAAAASAVLEALQDYDAGDILVFLPGAGEIRRTQTLLHEACMGMNVRIATLYGNLPADEQDRAIRPGIEGQRKVVLATSIAESSITVEGVRIVIDSGLMRVPRFSPRTGMSRLETVPVSRASADQRRGRAGRESPGICCRMWTEQEDKLLPLRGTPEIAESDLAPLALELAAWGAADPEELRWLDPPQGAALAQARELLVRLGALTIEGGAAAITPVGRRMAGMAAHPRLTHMVLRAIPLGLGEAACELAALLGERDILRGFGGSGRAPDADIRLRLQVLCGASAAQADDSAVRRIKLQAEQWKREWAVHGVDRAKANNWDSCGLLLSFAFPDRIASRRQNGKFLLSNGRGAVYGPDQPLSQFDYSVAAELDDSGADSRITLAAPVDREQLEEHHGSRAAELQEVVWDPVTQSVRARRRRMLDALVLSEQPLANPDPELLLRALLDGISQEGLEILPWTKISRQFRQRLQFLHYHDPGMWPDVSDAALASALEDWLGPHAYGMKSRADLQRLNVIGVLEAMLSWERRREMDEQAPTHAAVPSGSRIPIDYSDPEAPFISVRLQEVFGLQDTPRIAYRKVPLTIHLLSPAQRPVQVTRDLASFWKEAYFEVKKDLKGRYPKHYWPEDPYAAQPTNRAKPRQS